jgi:hypothetical protein
MQSGWALIASSMATSWDDECIALLLEHGTWYVPTLAISLKSLRHWSEPDPRGRGDLAQRRKWRAGPVCSGDSRMSIWS